MNANQRIYQPSDRRVPKQRTPGFWDNFLYPLVVDRRLKELSLFYRQLGGLIKSGIPFYQAVAHLEGQTNSRLLQRFLQESRTRIEAGGPFSEVLAAYPQLFSEMQIELVRAGESGGVLEEAILRVADYLEWELKIRRYLSRQTVYAKTVFVCIVWLLPTLWGLTMGTDMWQVILLSLSILFQLLCLGLLGLALFGLCRTLLSRWPALGDLYDRVKWRLPGIGGVTQKLAFARFGRTFALLYRAGLPMTGAIRAALRTSGSRVLSGLIPQILGDIEAGMPLVVAFRRSGTFPATLLERLDTGAQTGDLDNMMTREADYLEGEADTGAFQSAFVFSELFFLLVAFYLCRNILFGFLN